MKRRLHSRCLSAAEVGLLIDKTPGTVRKYARAGLLHVVQHPVEKGQSEMRIPPWSVERYIGSPIVRGEDGKWAIAAPEEGRR